MTHGIERYGSKSQLLSDLLSGRSVVHLGAIGTTEGTVDEKVAMASSSVHAAVTQMASSCVGVDIDKAAVDALARAGAFSNLIAGDVTRLQRDDIPLETIDVFFAGDIIEHLGNPGSMLSALRAAADPATRFVVTTPNALGAAQFLRYLRGRAIEGNGHLCSFNAYTLSAMLAEHGWQVASMATCYQSNAQAANGRGAFALGRRMFERWPALGGTLLAVATPG